LREQEPCARAPLLLQVPPERSATRFHFVLCGGTEDAEEQVMTKHALLAAAAAAALAVSSAAVHAQGTGGGAGAGASSGDGSAGTGGDTRFQGQLKGNTQQGEQGAMSAPRGQATPSEMGVRSGANPAGESATGQQGERGTTESGIKPNR
jgi:hypothetical protein